MASSSHRPIFIAKTFIPSNDRNVLVQTARKQGVSSVRQGFRKRPEDAHPLSDAALISGFLELQAQKASWPLRETIAFQFFRQALEERARSSGLSGLPLAKMLRQLKNRPDLVASVMRQAEELALKQSFPDVKRMAFYRLRQAVDRHCDPEAVHGPRGSGMAQAFGAKIAFIVALPNGPEKLQDVFRKARLPSLVGDPKEENLKPIS